eukprot:TRINITY_DN106565_c0_g1_i1.p1 TRINITY_DN106565_c0_g1~~TRINITY_DN106565_c0_g1_i1.p1  ORF type:complete len:526 (+),score=73.12 TRINITY_DN106565_c0_g1_i1:29-1606(+)
MACFQVEKGPAAQLMSRNTMMGEEIARLVVQHVAGLIDMKFKEHNQKLLAEIANVASARPLLATTSTDTQTDPADSRSSGEYGMQPKMRQTAIQQNGEDKPQSPTSPTESRTSMASMVSMMPLDDAEDAKTGSEEASSGKPMSCLDRIEAAMAVIIVLNFVQMCVETQFYGVQIGYKLYNNQTNDQLVQAFRNVMWNCELTFAGFYTVDVCLKVILLGWDWRKRLWNWFDLVLIILTYIELVFGFLMGAVLARIMRLGRLLRLTRLVQHVEFFEAFTLIIRSLKKSISSLVWSSAFMIGCVLIMSLATCQIVVPFCEDDSLQKEHRMRIYERFGTLTKTILTMFESTIGNWGPTAWNLVDNTQQEFFGAYCILYKLSMGYAVVNVINAVFLRQTMKCADAIDDFTIAQQKKVRENYINKLAGLFHQMDASGDGLVDREEFHELCSRDDVIAWFDMLEISAKDTESLFDCLAAGDGSMTLDEFVEGIKRLKGDATAVDAMTLLSAVSRIEKHMQVLEAKVDKTLHR